MGASTPILIIKLGALGDFIQALGPIESICQHHKNSHITLLTTGPFEELAKATNFFDKIIIDTRPRFLNLLDWVQLRRMLRSRKFSRVYDLQTSQRTSFYFHILWPGPFPEWSGIAMGCSHPHKNINRNCMHTLDRQFEQLCIAGIKPIKKPNYSWVSQDTQKFQMPKKFVLLVPGSNINRRQKRWPVKCFGTIAEIIKKSGLSPVIIGSENDTSLAKEIVEIEPTCIDLTGKTSLPDLMSLAKAASLAIGNDTGPMHICASIGCVSFVLFSDVSNPDLCAPRGKSVKIIKVNSLQNLSVKRVAKYILPFLYMN